MHIYPMKSQGEDIFILFSPHSFLGLCCVIIIIPTPCSITLCTLPPQQFLGLWYLVLLINAGLQLATEQDTVPSASVSRTGPVILTSTLFRFVWWTEWQIIKRHILSIFLFFFFFSIKSWSQITSLSSKFLIILLEYECLDCDESYRNLSVA